MEDKIINIVHQKEEVKYGPWNLNRGGCYAFFFRKENDVVLLKESGEFITILKDGAQKNGQFKSAKRIQD